MLGDGILDDDSSKRKTENKPGEERHGAVDAFPTKLKASCLSHLSACLSSWRYGSSLSLHS
jgi:hypothetical protein